MVRQPATYYKVILLLGYVIVLVANVQVNGFLIALPQQIQKISLSPPVVSSFVTLRQQHFDDYGDEEDGDNEVVLTPIQIRAIRKDIIRKRANNRLPTIYYNSDDDDDSTSDVLLVEQQIIDTLKSDQLVQVRGIALHDSDTRTIRSEAEQLTYRIQKQVQQQQQQQQQQQNVASGTSSSKSALAHVFLVEMKGHTATLFYYIPRDQLTTPFHQQHLKINTAVLSSNTTTGTTRSRLSPKVQLRTTGKRNDWKKRPKALRDNSGQIIK